MRAKLRAGIMTNHLNLLTTLQSLGQHIPRIELDCASDLLELEVVRVVPGKRVVCSGFWQQQRVYAKIFLGNQSQQYADRDKKGVQWLMQADVATPLLLASHQLASTQAVVLIYQAIEGGETVELAYARFSARERLQLMTLLVQTIAQHHHAGLIQTDCYLKNFLVKDHVIYTLDGDGVRAYRHLSARKMAENLTVLLSKMDILEVESWCGQLLQCYQSAYDLPAIVLQRLKPSVRKVQARVAARYAEQKVFRQCTDVNVNQHQGSFVAVRRHFAHLAPMLKMAGLDQYLTQDCLIKNGNTCTVFDTKLDGAHVVIKRYNMKSVGHYLSRMLRPSRAAISWANAHRLMLLGIKTATPVALVERRMFGFLRGKAYFVTLFVDAPDVAEFFQQTQHPDRRAQSVQQMAELFYRLYLLKLSHGDMKASNIKVLSDGCPLLIDLDSMRQHRSRFFAQNHHVRDLKRFMQNWKDTPTLYNAYVEAFKVVYTEQAPLKAAKILE